MEENRNGGFVPVHSLEDYYSGYAKTLRVVTHIMSFIIPIFVCVVLAFLLYRNFGWNAWLAGLTGVGSYACIAFVSWLIFSYLTKVFDILSLMGHNVEYIAWMVGDDED